MKLDFSHVNDGIWEMIIALSGIEDYAGTMDKKGDLHVKRIDEMKPNERLIDRDKPQ